MTKKLTVYELSKRMIYHEKRANYYLNKLITAQNKRSLIGFQYTNDKNR